MIGIVDQARAETDLAAGELSCPGCGGTLRRWGHARVRRVRDHASTTMALRPRRTRCAACGATHVLLLGAVLPRRADTTEMIGTALLASARGVGYGRIAADLGRPASTVQRWVRSVRDAHTEWLHAQAVGWIDAVDRDPDRVEDPTRRRAEYGRGRRAGRPGLPCTARADLDTHRPGHRLATRPTRRQLRNPTAGFSRARSGATLPTTAGLTRGRKAASWRPRRHPDDQRRPECPVLICTLDDAYIVTVSGGQHPFLSVRRAGSVECSHH